MPGQPRRDQHRGPGGRGPRDRIPRRDRRPQSTMKSFTPVSVEDWWAPVSSATW
jgi:hypothetical protein